MTLLGEFWGCRITISSKYFNSKFSQPLFFMIRNVFYPKLQVCHYISDYNDSQQLASGL